MLSKRLLRSHATEEIKPQTLHYIEFQTALIKLSGKLAKQKLSDKELFQKIIQEKNLFKKVSHDCYQLSVAASVFPESKPILITLLPEEVYEGHPMMAFHFHEGTTLFLSIYFSKGSFYTKDYGMKNNAELQELITSLRQIFYPDNLVSPLLVSKEMLSKKRFERSIERSRYQFISYRINHLILKNSIQEEDAYTFHLKWSDLQKKSYPLKISFSRTDQFYSPDQCGTSDYSWVFTESVLLNRLPEYKPYRINTGQHFYSLSVCEEKKEESRQVLKIWFSLDAVVGELHGLNKGIELSGNEVINIYRYFDRLFQIKTTFVCDSSKLNRYVSLRVLLPLITGKTWYEDKLHFSLFECKNFPTAHDGLVTQNKITHRKAITELQTLKIKEWYPMLDEDKKRILNDLVVKYDEEKKSENSDTPLCTFAEKIYRVSKGNKEVSSDLTDLCLLLMDKIYFYRNDHLVMEERKDASWVRSRVSELFHGGYFWVKKLDREEKEEKMEIEESYGNTKC